MYTEGFRQTLANKLEMRPLNCMCSSSRLLSVVLLTHGFGPVLCGSRTQVVRSEVRAEAPESESGPVFGGAGRCGAGGRPVAGYRGCGVCCGALFCVLVVKRVPQG